MGIAENLRHVSGLIISHADLHALVADLTQSIAQICQADAVVFDFGDLATDAQTDPVSAPQDNTKLVDALTGFVNQKAKRSDGTRPYGIAPHIENNVEYLFVIFPLMREDQRMGAFALAISRDAWKAQHSLDLCTQIAKLVAVNVFNTCSKIDLELDLVATRQSEKRIARQAELDPLTQVENKSAFQRKARAHLNGRIEPAAFVTLDVDNFKTVNDIYGHTFGDTYLCSVADCLRNIFPDDTIIGRTGGDEFCLMVNLPTAGRSYLDGLIKRLRAALQRAAALYGKPELGRLSVGISIFPVQANDYDWLFEMADAALYSSKRYGRNTTTVYQGELESYRNTRDFAHRFSAAIEKNQIQPSFQPIVCLETGHCTGFEVLARWRDPVKGLIPPKSFEPAFRDQAMAETLSNRVIERALQRITSLPKTAGRHPDLWFNLTSFDLLNAEFVFDFQSVLNRFGFNWDSVVIEVTERVMLGEKSGQVYRSIQEVRHRGGRVAFDDFGTGHASLMHIRDWPVDIIKIDSNFTRDVHEGVRERAVIAAMLQLANAMGQEVVAEGIETRAQLDHLRELGCKLGQGFLFDHPIATENMHNHQKTYDLDDL